MTEGNPIRPPEGGPKEPTHAQLSTARVQYVFALESIIKKKAEAEHGWEAHHNPKAYRDVKRTIKNLVILSVLKDNDVPLDKFRKRHKEKAPDYERMLGDITEEIEEKKNEIMGRAGEISPQEREDTNKKALKLLKSTMHRKALVALVEPDPVKRRKERRKGIISAGWSIPTTIAAFAGPGLGAVAAANLPFVELGSITDLKTLLTVTGVTAANAAVIYANYRAQLYSLDKVGISMSFLAKTSHYTTTQLLPENEHLTQKGVLLATAGPSIWQIPLLTLGLLIPGAGPLASIAFVGHGIASIATNGLEAAGTAGNAALRRGKDN